MTKEMEAFIEKIIILQDQGFFKDSDKLDNLVYRFLDTNYFIAISIRDRKFYFVKQYEYSEKSIQVGSKYFGPIISLEDVFEDISDEIAEKLIFNMHLLL